MFFGSIVAMITPFDTAGEVDTAAFDRLIEWHIEQGTHGIVPCGTTGETPVLSDEEHMALITRCVKTAAGRIPVIAGTGSNRTVTAVRFAQHAQKAGADAILTVVPYYNKPPQEGIYQHFKAVHDATDIPMIIYNVPGRTVANIEVDTLCRLAELPRIVGIKDASPDLCRPLEMRLRLGEDFCLLSGEDGTIAAYLAQGGQGCISVTANVAPKLCAELHEAWRDRDFDTFETRRNQLMKMHELLFVETSPAPAKYAAYKMGQVENVLRLPLIPVTESLAHRLDAELKKLGLI
ncbi:MAG: 4-hydroxy-tetrahydrodipicolinate synthase [Pseudomonadota bacterium]